MVFESLSDRLQKTLRKLKSKGKIYETDIDEMLKEIRVSLIEADVNFKVIKKFLGSIKEKCLGQKVLEGLNPGQQVVSIVRDEIKEILGSKDVELNIQSNMTVIMMAGLQGTGKTTTCGKLAIYLRKKLKKRPMLIAADIYRPAAIDQLITIGKQIGVPVYSNKTLKPVEIVKEGIKEAGLNGCNCVIIDTAGRLQIDEELMEELANIEKVGMPHETLLVVDSMAGQDSVNVALAFNEKIKVTGIVLTKLDGDSRGGSAFSIKHLTGIDIKLMGSGETLDALEVFYPDRLADRILGMGDVLTLIDTVKENIEEEEMERLSDRMMSGKYNFIDLKKQFSMLKKMGSFSKILSMIPGISKYKDVISKIDSSNFNKLEVIIDSMTEKERKNPDLIKSSASRRQRIAKGSGTTVSDVNTLINSLDNLKQGMKKFNGMDEAEIKNMQRKMAAGNYSDFAPNNSKYKKGKGKGKGDFRF